MNCKDVSELITDMDRDALSTELQPFVAAHIDVCARCHSEWVSHREYLRAARNFVVPEPAPGHFAHLLREARLQGERLTPRRRSQAPFMRNFVAASLVAVALTALLHYFPSTAPVIDNMVAVTLDNGQLFQEVTVVINVPADMRGANLALQFPDSVRLAGLEEKQRIAWAVDLLAGPNVLTLPLTIRTGTHSLRPLFIAASVEYNNKVKDFQLPVELVTLQNSRHGALLLRDDPAHSHT